MTMGPESQPGKVVEASIFDTVRVMKTVVAPTIAKGVIKRRASVEALAQHHGLDTKALRLLQDLRRKYGNGPLLLRFPFRSQVLLLDPSHVAQVLSETPVPFASASKEKRSALAHFEPGNILISDASRRAELRPVHEDALAANDRVHPFAEHFKNVVNEELQCLLDNPDGGVKIDLDWDKFSQAWFRIIRRISLGDAARDDERLTGDLDNIRRRANWGFAAFTNKRKLESFQAQLERYLQNREEGSLVSRLPNSSGLDLESQVAQWLFAFDAAGMATFRALALLGCQPDQQSKAIEEANAASADHPFSRAIIIDALRLWPTSPAILRELTKDHQVGGQTFKKGTAVIIFAPFFHRDNERLAFADQMSPSTWINNESDLSAGLVPFSAGPAMCPAHNLVPMVASLVMAALLSKATITLVQPLLDPKALPGTLDNFEIKLRLSKQTAGAE